MRSILAYLTLMPLIAGCCGTEEAVFLSHAVAPTAAHRPVAKAVTPRGAVSADSATVVEMRNVHFRVDANLTLNIRQLRGHMSTLPGHDVIDFGDPSSFYLDLAHAEIGMTMDNLTYLLREYVFGYEGSPLTIERIEAEGNQIRQFGTLHNVVDIPFEMTSEAVANEDGRIRLRPTSMQICNIPGQGLMRALGIQLEALLDLSGARGVTAEGDDLLMDPELLLPPPAIRGRIASVRIEDGEFVQVFGRPDLAPAIPPASVANADNYMFYAGGTLRFGKLYMVDADLQIIDEDPSDPFDFFLQEYLAQLVAGESRTMPDAGLAAYFPDYSDLSAGSSTE